MDFVRVVTWFRTSFGGFDDSVTTTIKGAFCRNRTDSYCDHVKNFLMDSDALTIDQFKCESSHAYLKTKFQYHLLTYLQKC